jgi:hypothetical protein
MTDEAPAPPPRKRRTGRRLVVILVVVAVVCCGGAAAAAYGLFRLGTGVGPPRTAADTFLSDLERDDTAGAYGLLCGAVRGHLSQDSFTAFVAAQSHLRSHKIVNTSLSTVNGQASALVSADLTRDSGAGRQSMTLVKENGQWRVCGSPY